MHQDNKELLKKAMRIALWTAFGIYCMALVVILFLDARNYRHQGESLWDYIRFSVNLIPFRTIGDYISHLIESRVYLTLVIRNIFGNLVLFFPMGIFLPCLTEKMQRLWKTALAVFAIIFIVELLQLLLRRGIFDIDDFILNMLGCIFGYALTRLGVIRKLLKKLYLLP